MLDIYPGSVVFKYKQPEWVVFHEVVHTTKKFMREITVIEPEWLTELAYVLVSSHVVQRRFSSFSFLHRPHFFEYRHREGPQGKTAAEVLRESKLERGVMSFMQL